MKARWWDEHLTAWAQCVGTEPQVGAYDAPELRRNVGDWWRNGNDWRVHLDELHYAEFTGDNLNATMRKTFTWGIQALSHFGVPTWQQVVLNWFQDLESMSEDALRLARHEHRLLPPGVMFNEQTPGRFVWLRLSISETLISDQLEEIQSTVLQIVDAFAPIVFVGWVHSAADRYSALLYITTCDEAGDAEEETSGDELEDLDIEPRHELVNRLSELVQTVTTEALIHCAAAVGMEVSELSGIYYSLASTISAWHRRSWESHTRKVVVWEDKPLHHLLQSLTTETMTEFLSVARLRFPLADLELSPELIEALHGVVAANLNVSEAARLLYLHRNTLMNRIERVRTQTGYDIRNFDDALTLWLATAIKRKLAGLTQDDPE